MGVVVPFEEARDPADGIKPLLEIVAEDMQAVNRIILDKAVSDVELIPTLAHHLIDSGGKRLRPMLTIASAKLCGYAGEGHVRLAAAVEFMHTATLLHDAVVDESEVLQLAAAKNTATTEDDYLTIISAKTAALFAAAAEVGAAIAKRPVGEQAALKSYGRNLGIAFQLVDDALDYSGDSSRLGKSVGDDFREGKITLPVILCFRRGGEEERAFWNRALGGGQIEDGDLERAISLMKRHSAIDATLERARHYGKIAQDALAIVPPDRHTKALTDVIGFCVSRSS